MRKLGRLGVGAAGIVMLFADLVHGAPPGDYFATLREKTFVQTDEAFLVREAGAPRDGPPIAKVRHVVLRLEQKDLDERRMWPKRDLLLLTMRSGRRWSVEWTRGPLDLKELDRPEPVNRIAGERAGALVELWNEGQTELDAGSELRKADPARNCDMRKTTMFAGKASTWWFNGDTFTETVRFAVADTRGDALTEDEVKELLIIPPLTPQLATAAHASQHSFDSRLSVIYGLADRVRGPASLPRIAVERDPAPIGDLGAWRGLTYLPLLLTPWVPPPADERFSWMDE